MYNEQISSSDKMNTNSSPYSKLYIMSAISFCVMYIVMFLNVDNIDHIYFSLTRAYMALLMVTPMVVLMLILMKKMYSNKKLNLILHISSISLFIISLIFLRAQVFVSDTQYMKAMIPHHSSAILTSKNANIQRPEVKKLSEGIISSQEKEISEMKQYLGEK